MHPIGLVAIFKPFVSNAREGKGFFFNVPQILWECWSRLKWSENIDKYWDCQQIFASHTYL